MTNQEKMTAILEALADACEAKTDAIRCNCKSLARDAQQMIDDARKQLTALGYYEGSYDFTPITK